MDKKEFQVKMMFYIMAKGFEEIAKVDEEFQEDLEDIDGIVQWNIGNIRAYLKFDEGKYQYLIERFENTSNSLLKARYAHILWCSPRKHA